MTFPAPALVVMDGWGGRHWVRITLLDETPKRYHARLEEEAALPHRGRCRVGYEWLVPKSACILGDPRATRTA